MSVNLEQELQKIGLSEKEAKVYLASLELGSSTAQTIAAKAVVNRPTTYVMIESLIKRGLMSSFEKGKKRYFVASNPSQLLYTLDNERREIEAKKDVVNKVVDYYGQIVSGQSSFFSAHVYEGAAGLIAVQEAIFNSDAKKMIELTSSDVSGKQVPPLSEKDLRKKIIGRFKEIVSIDANANSKIDYSMFPNVKELGVVNSLGKVTCDIMIFGDRVAIVDYQDKPKAVIIQSKNFAETMTTLVESAAGINVD